MPALRGATRHGTAHAEMAGDRFYRPSPGTGTPTHTFKADSMERTTEFPTDHSLLPRLQCWTCSRVPSLVFFHKPIFFFFFFCGGTSR